MGSPGRAFPYLVKSLELDPGNTEVRLKLGTIYLQARQPDKAWEQATLVLEKEPKNLDGLVLLANSASTPEHVGAATRRVEGLRADLASEAKLYAALGPLYVRKGDVRGAEQAFREAVAREPKSVEAHMNLAYFYERQRDDAKAEGEYRAAAALGPVDSIAPVKLAEFLASRKRDEAKQLLGQITQKSPDYIPAWRGIAQIAFVEGNWVESDKAIGVILKKNPGDLEGHFLRGRIYRIKRQTPQAIQEFQTVLKLEPRSAQARYELALTYLQAGNVQQARAELKEATTLDPNLTGAALLLAELDIQAGAHQPAIEALEQVVAKHPEEVRAYILLGSAYRAKREPARATEIYRKMVARFPKDPRGPYLVGVALQAEGKQDETKKQFEAALALSPGVVDATAQLVAIAFSQKQPGVALERVKRQIALAPTSAGLYDLLGKVHLARQELDLAENAFAKALELDPNRSST
jgi:tetratricopeptide (TPR) repeat protein